MGRFGASNHDMDLLQIRYIYDVYPLSILIDQCINILSIMIHLIFDTYTSNNV